MPKLIVTNLTTGQFELQDNSGLSITPFVVDLGPTGSSTASKTLQLDTETLQRIESQLVAAATANQITWSWIDDAASQTDNERDAVRVGTTTPIAVTVLDSVVISKLAAPGAVSVTLPTTPPLGMEVLVVDGTGDAGANNITVHPAAGTIDGAATAVIATNYGRLSLVYSGTEWLAKGVVPTSGTSTLATMVPSVRSGSVRYVAPIAEEVVAIVAAVTPTNVALTVISQPDVPRALTVDLVIDTTHAITAGSLAVVGIGASGEAVTENVSLITAASTTLRTNHAFAHITSATVSAITMTGGAGGTTIGVGNSKKLGLPGCKTPASSTFAVYKTNVNQANETVAGVDATYGTVTPTSVPDASKNYEFYYNYTVTEVQVAHTHTLA